VELPSALEEEQNSFTQHTPWGPDGAQNLIPLSPISVQVLISGLAPTILFPTEVNPAEEF